MSMFEITLTDSSKALVVDAEGYGVEGPMTTFFNSDRGSGRLDSWAVRLASVRSADVLMIRRVPDTEQLGRPQLDLVAGGAA